MKYATIMLQVIIANIAIQRITLALVFMKNGTWEKWKLILMTEKKRNIYTFKLINENKIKK